MKSVSVASGPRRFEFSKNCFASDPAGVVGRLHAADAKARAAKPSQIRMVLRLVMKTSFFFTRSSFASLMEMQIGCRSRKQAFRGVLKMPVAEGLVTVHIVDSGMLIGKPVILKIAKSQIPVLTTKTSLPPCSHSRLLRIGRNSSDAPDTSPCKEAADWQTQRGKIWRSKTGLTSAVQPRTGLKP